MKNPINIINLSREEASSTENMGCKNCYLKTFPNSKSLILQGINTTFILTISLILLVCPSSLAQPGSLDTSFDPGTGITGTGANTMSPTVAALAVQSDGKILLGGYEFNHYDGTMVSTLVRIESDGEIDNDFVNAYGTTNTPLAKITSIVIQPDGKILFTGGWYLNRLLPDGSQDTDFVFGNGTLDTVTFEGRDINAVALQPDGKIIIAGAFFKYHDVSTNRYNIVRLNIDGTVDTTFNGLGNGTINSIALQPDGKILIAGTFSYYDGVSRKSIARLNSDGSLDETFDPGSGVEGLSGAPSEVETISLQQDGKIIIAGWFSVFDGVGVNRVARLNENGSLDPTFNVGNGISSGQVYTSIIQPDGKILLGGLFSGYNDFATGGGIARINTDGSPDTTFKAGANEIRALALQSDDKILIGGNFNFYDSISRSKIARLLNDSSMNIAENAFEDNIVIYPNPVTQILFVESNTVMQRIEFFDIQGKKIAEYTLGSFQTEVSMETLKSGMYLMKIHTEGRSTTRKILKE